MFSSPFDVNVEQAPEEFQMELIELQRNDDLKRDMKDYSLLEFYKRLPEESFPKIEDLARKKNVTIWEYLYLRATVHQNKAH